MIKIPKQDGEEPPEETISIKDSIGLKSGKYSKKHIANLISAAKTIGVNPHSLIALALQESGIGTAKEKQIYGRTSRNKATTNFLGQVSDFTPQQEEELNRLSLQAGIGAEYLKPAIVLRDKLNLARRLGIADEAMQLQAYNGYGLLMPRKDASGKAIPTRYYGIDVPETGIDMRQNPLYGKRLVSLKNDLLSNKEISELINK